MIREPHFRRPLARNWRVVAALVPAALLLAAAGCKPAASANGNTGDIKVGEFASLTGKEAAFGQSSHKGTALAVDEINANGGVLGRKIDLLTEDDESKEGESKTIAEKLISRDGVIALLGEVASSRSLEAAPVCQSRHIPQISPSSTNPKVTQIGDYIFRVCFTDPFQGKTLAKFARETLKAKRIAVLTDVATAYSVGLAKYFDEEFTNLGGEIAVEQKYSGGDSDFKAQLTTIKAADADALFIPGYYTDVGLIARQARELGLTYPMFGGDGWEAPELLTIGGPAVEGCYYSTHYSPEVKTPQVQKFVADFKAKNGSVPDAMAALGYDSAMILADAIKRAGTTDGPKLRDALAQTKDFPGVAGKVTIDSERNARKPLVILEVTNGGFHLLQQISAE